MINKSNSNISFSSGINFVNKECFKKLASRIPENNYVKYPWSINETVKAPAAYTKNIYDCTAGGITDGKDVVMFHIAPNQQNLSQFDLIAKNILNKIDLRNPDLQGFLLGSSEEIPASKKLFQMFESLMNKYKIKYSALSGHKQFSDSNILYDSTKDDWFITNEQLTNSFYKKQQSPKEIAEKLFVKTHISDLDELNML